MSLAPDTAQAEIYRESIEHRLEPGETLMFAHGFNVRYGQNPYDLVMYGPSGEVVRESRTVRVPFSRLPDGRFEYAVALGQCRYQPCDGLVSAVASFAERDAHATAR